MNLGLLLSALPTWYIVGMGILFTLLFICLMWQGSAKVKGGKKRVKNGPLGDAKFASAEELSKEYETIDFKPEEWRKNPDSRPTEPGLLLGDWHVSGKKKGKEKPFYYDKNGKWCGGTVKTRLFMEDQNAAMVAAAGSGKTSFVLAPQIEYALACGISFITTDTKGDIVDKWAPIAKEYYGYNIINYDLGHPLRSARFNIIGSVNKYIDLWKEECAKGDRNSEKALGYLAKAESYAKAVAKTIIMQGTDGNFGANSFFYDSAEGLLQAVILIVSKYAEEDQRHILSVYQIIQEVSGNSVDPETKQKVSQVKELLDKLPPGDNAKLFAGSAAQGGDSQASVVSTALSRLLSFLDSEISPMLCGKTDLDVEKFAKTKTVIFLTVPEEQETRFFMLSLIVQETYNELLELTREYGNKVPKTDGFNGEDGHQRIMFFLDEVGSLPKISGLNRALSASRSRRIFFFNIVQSLSQLEKNYGKEETDIILANSKLLFVAGLAPLSNDVPRISKVLGKYTIETNSASTSGRPTGGSTVGHSVQMTAIDLMSETEIQQDLGLGKVLIMRAGNKPILSHFDLFLDWGIKLNLPPLAFETHKASDIKSADKESILKALDEYKKDQNEATIKEKTIKIMDEKKELEHKLAEEENEERRKGEQLLQNMISNGSCDPETGALTDKGWEEFANETDRLYSEELRKEREQNSIATEQNTEDTTSENSETESETDKIVEPTNNLTADEQKDILGELDDINQSQFEDELRDQQNEFDENDLANQDYEDSYDESEDNDPDLTAEDFNTSVTSIIASAMDYDDKTPYKEFSEVMTDKENDAFSVPVSLHDDNDDDDGELY